MKDRPKDGSNEAVDRSVSSADSSSWNEVKEAARLSKRQQYATLWFFVVGVPLIFIVVELQKAKIEGVRFTSMATLGALILGFYLWFRLDRWSSKK